MTDLPKIIDALNELRNEHGEDLDDFINYDAFLRRRDLVEHCRTSVERTVGRRFLPGFRFASINHARWHFRNRDYLPFWIMDLQSKEEHWVENWIRAAFVPSVKHYCYEVANALKKFDGDVTKTVGEYREIQASGDKAQIGRAGQIVQLRRGGRNLPPGPVGMAGDLMAMPPWTERISKLFPVDTLPTTSRTLDRWSHQAEGRRKARMKADTPSGWYIDYISYFGEMPCPEGHDEDVWHNAFHDYFELWKWAPIPGVVAPKCTKMSFKSVAPLSLWNPSAKKVSYEFDD